MTLIKAGNLEFYYEEQDHTLFDNLIFEIDNTTKAGLIGRNGCGKTTLFSLLLQKLKPVGGNMYFQPELRIGHLPQEIVLDDEIIVQDYLWQMKLQLYNLKLKMDRIAEFEESELIKILADFDSLGGYEFDLHFQKILAQFNLDESFLFRKVKNLSGGEKTKIAFCRIMLDNPDLLLLDEPTNHLDIQTLEWLENYLKNISIPFLIISHDRKFLDNCVQEIWEIEDKRIFKFSGNYSFYKNQKEEELNRKLHDYENSRKRIKKLKKAVNDRKGWAVSHQAETGNEGYAPIYETVGNEAKKSMRQAKAVETRLIRELEKAQENKPWIEKKREIRFEEQNLKVRSVLQVESLSKSYAGKNVLQELNFTVGNGSRLLISGKNGSGKSTLLKILVDQIQDYAGNISWNPQAKIGYYAQEIDDLNLENTILDELIAGDLSRQTVVRTVLGSLNLRKDKVYQKISSLSIGERCKITLAKIITSNANVLLLDEPTNHLEIAAREALENALLQFEGAIIFVSHDRYLCEKLATDEINLDGKR
ncbi:MAG: hypothetical protein APR54_01790 [Candidatus Cloacimonas sp. SDB]|nr:MAG: hypothetical protein APR54_01790 [Candidatus Cloacimonas sp. SDB]